LSYLFRHQNNGRDVAGSSVQCVTVVQRR